MMKKAFSILEISMIIIIISILISGIIISRQLVDNAKAAMLIKDMEKYDLAYKSFELNYNFPPGDFNQAAAFFGCSSCNGSGNGFIHDGDAVQYDNTETRNAPQHLALSKIIEGNYDASSGDAIIATNVPGTRYGDGSIIFYSSSSLWSKFRGTNQHNYITIQGEDDSSTDTIGNPKIKVADSYRIDQKIDDGKPYTGILIAFANGANICVATHISTVAVANLGDHDYYLTSNTNCNLGKTLDGEPFD